MALLCDSSSARLAFLCDSAHHQKQIGATVSSPHGKRTSDMSMLTHSFERPFNWAERPELISGERKARLKRVALRALAALAMGGVLTALIALKTAIFVWNLHA
jgi:hypothetical protein